MTCLLVHGAFPVSQSLFTFLKRRNVVTNERTTIFFCICWGYYYTYWPRIVHAQGYRIKDTHDSPIFDFLFFIFSFFLQQMFMKDTISLFSLSLPLPPPSLARGLLACLLGRFLVG